MIDKLPTLFDDNWRTRSAADIATALSAPATLQPMTREQFLGLAVQSGANPKELGKLWAFSEYMISVRDALEGGGLEGMTALIATMPIDLPAETLAAVNAAVAATTLNAGGTQEAFSEEGVTAALQADGYTWSGSEWVRA